LKETVNTNVPRGKAKIEDVHITWKNLNATHPKKEPNPSFLKHNDYYKQLLSQKVYKLPITSIDLRYIVTKTTASLKNTVKVKFSRYRPRCPRGSIEV
jgi:hypothetical protein